MNRISDSEMKQAAEKVRSSMLAALDDSQIPEHDFSAEFEAKILALREREQRRQKSGKILRHCAAAILALVLCTGVFLSVNVEARAAVILWVKEVYEDGIAYWFTGKTQEELPQYELTWIPDNMDRIYDETTESSHSMVYSNSSDPQLGFTFSYSLMQDGSGTIMVLNETEHSVTVVDINGMPGELYLSQDPEVTHCLIWFDEDQQVTFNITSYMDADAMLHIAESVKLASSKN